MKDGADRGGVGLGDDKHPQSMAMSLSIGKPDALPTAGRWCCPYSRPCIVSPGRHEKPVECNGCRLMTNRKIKPPITTTPPQKFNELLAWHMASGTRPDASGKPQASWHSARLAEAAHCNGASIRNWRRGRFVPGERHLYGLIGAFFGDSLLQQEARTAFLAAWEQACSEHRYGLLRINRESPEAVRSLVITQLSNLCRALGLPLAGVHDAADHLLGDVTPKQSKAA